MCIVVKIVKEATFRYGTLSITIRCVTSSAAMIPKTSAQLLYTAVVVPWSAPTGFLKDVGVEALLRGHLCRVVVGTDPELEVAHVVGRQLDPHLHPLVPFAPVNAF